MSTMLTRLMGQAESSLAEAARRTVDSVTAPIVLKTQTIATETIGAATRTVKALLIKAVLGLFAAGMGIVAIVYALAALYEALLPVLGPVEARLAMAGAFALLAVIAILAMVFWPKGKTATTTAPGPAAQPIADARRAMAEAQAAATEAAAATRQAARATATENRGAAFEAAAPASALGDHFDTIVDVLGEAGFHREQAGLRAGLALASQLKPMQIVALALIGGFIAGVRR